MFIGKQKEKCIDHFGQQNSSELTLYYKENSQTKTEKFLFQNGLNMLGKSYDLLSIFWVDIELFEAAKLLSKCCNTIEEYKQT